MALDYDSELALSTTAPATTYTLPNFVGELFSLVPAQTPLLSMSGGLTGGKSVNAKEFTWQVENNAAALVNRAVLEGAGPTPTAVIRQEVKNVVEIHNEGVNISYTKQAAVGMTGAGGDALGDNAGYAIESAQILGNQPVTNEVTRQLALKINQIARDVELSFLSGVYANPVDNATVRKTNGVLTAIATHDVTFATDIRTTLNVLLAGMYEDELNTAPLIQPVLFMNGTTKTQLSIEYTNNLGLADRSRTIGGVNVETIVTDFGTFGVVLDRYMPTDEIALLDMSVISPCFLAIPGKGHFFTEPLAKTGAFDLFQIYGEIGVEYGPEQFHGKISTIT